MDIKFKSLGDVKSVLEALEITLQDLVNLFDLQKQQIQAKLKIKADVFLLDQPEAPVAEVLTDGQIKVPGGVQKITDSYSLLIELQEQLDTLQQASVAVDIQFAEEPKAQQVLDEIARLKGKVVRQYHEVADFLNDVATQTVPPQFHNYVMGIAATLVEHVHIFEDQYAVCYYLSTYNNQLLYTAFIELHDIENKDGEHVPELYAVVHWLVANSQDKSETRLNLAYRFELPSIMFENSTAVASNINEAITLFDSMLESENFVIGHTESIQDPTLSIISLKDKLESVEVEPDFVIVNIKPNVLGDQLTEVQSQLYLGVQRLFNPNTKLSLTIDGFKLKCAVVSNAGPVDYSQSDIQCFKSWGLSDSQIKKIQVILGN